MKYEKPTYECELIELSDIVLTSANGIVSAGEGTVGNITGEKGVFEALFERIF